MVFSSTYVRDCSSRLVNTTLRLMVQTVKQIHVFGMVEPSFRHVLTSLYVPVLRAYADSLAGTWDLHINAYCDWFPLK